MSQGKPASDWDYTVDILVVGSGAGAMTAALCAHDRGASTLLIEKDESYGGSTAMSGGALWIPSNHLMEGVGVPDTPEEALDYLMQITERKVPEDKLQAYVRYGREMVEYLCERSRLELQALPEYADYYPEVSGGKSGARTMEPINFDARLLGDEFDRMREPALQTLITKRIAMTAKQAHVLLCRSPGWGRLMFGLMAGYWLDFGGRVKSKRDRNLALGNALIGMLRLSLMDRDVAIWLKTAARQLIVEEGRVVGVLAERGKEAVRIRAERGVILAAGGFESNDEMRRQYLPNPTQAEWTCGSPCNTGDAIRMGMEVDAALEWMDDAWWGPTTVVPGEDRARMLVVEKSLPGCVFVDQRGKRFVDEAAPYIDIVNAMYRSHGPGASCVPAYMVFDATYRKKYPCGPFLQSSQQPDWRLPKEFKQGYLKKAESLAGLADQMGIDPEGLEATVRKMNEYARTGKDLDFKKGDSLYDRYYGDANVKPNPCLAPIEKPPFYGLEVQAGDLGTKGGLKTDARSRVLNQAGEAIPGLYAIGNCSGSVMGRTYAGAGSTIGPAMTFGYVAVLDAVPS
jgi:3-oxosteroid 1-dehydrogenase